MSDEAPSYLETYRYMMLGLQYIREVNEILAAMRADNWNGLRDMAQQKCEEYMEEMG